MRECKPGDSGEGLRLQGFRASGGGGFVAQTVRACAWALGLFAPEEVEAVVPAAFLASQGKDGQRNEQQDALSGHASQQG